MLAVHREELIILGIFSKVINSNFSELWIIIEDSYEEFAQTGLKKRSVIRADKIATVNQSVLEKKLGILPPDILLLVQEAVKKSLNL